MQDRRVKHSNIIPVLSSATYEHVNQYLDEIKQHEMQSLLQEGRMGHRLYEVLKDSDIQQLGIHEFIDALLKTTMSRRFVKNTDVVRGNGTDWTKTEISLLGRITGVVENVTIYSTIDDILAEQQGHAPTATLLFIHPALLAGCGADLDRVIEDGVFNQEKYDRFLEDNLLPSLIYANNTAGLEGAIVTMPVLSGGAFAGDYFLEINAYFQHAIQRLINTHSERLQGIRGVIITGLKGERCAINGIAIIPSEEAVDLTPRDIEPGFKQYKTYVCVTSNPLLTSPCNAGKASTSTNVYTRITGVRGKIKGDDMIYSPEGGGDWESLLPEIKFNFSEMKVYGQEADAHLKAWYSFSKAYRPNDLDPRRPADYVGDPGFFDRHSWLENALVVAGIAVAFIAVGAEILMLAIAAGEIIVGGTLLFALSMAADLSIWGYLQFGIKGFSDRYPWVIDALIGVGIGLGILFVLVVALCPPAAGGVVVLTGLLGLGTTIGTAFALGGSAAVGVGLAVLGTSIIAGCAAFTAGAGTLFRYCFQGDEVDVENNEEREYDKISGSTHDLLSKSEFQQNSTNKLLLAEREDGAYGVRSDYGNQDVTGSLKTFNTLSSLPDLSRAGSDFISPLKQEI